MVQLVVRMQLELRLKTAQETSNLLTLASVYPRIASTRVD